MARVNPAVPLWCSSIINSDVNKCQIVLFHKNINISVFTLPFRLLETLQQNCINFINIATIIIFRGAYHVQSVF